MCDAARSTFGQVANQSLVEVYAACLSAGSSWAPYVNTDGQLPEHLAWHEAANLVLGALTLAHACSVGGARVWLGIALFGFCFEVVGLLVGSHAHVQYVVQLSYCVPLKEVLWYPLTTWPSFYVAHQLRLSVMSEAMLVGLLQMIVNIPYEAIGKREGINMLAYSENFGFARVQDTWGYAPVINVLANLVLPSFAAMVARWTLRKRTSFLSSALLIGLCVPLAGPFFAPYSAMKLSGCAHLVDALPALDFDAWRRGRFDPMPWMEWYQTCMQHSKMDEASAWSVFVVVYMCVVASELAQPSRRLAPLTALHTRHASIGWLLPLVPIVQIAEYVVIVWRHDQTPGAFTPTLILSLNLALAHCAIVRVVNRHLRTTAQESTPKKAR